MTRATREWADEVAALENVANQAEVIMAPHAGLDPGKGNGEMFTTGLALAAWDRCKCPASVTADRAQSLARPFIAAFKDGSQARRRICYSQQGS